MIIREKYLEKLVNFKDTEFIKVLSGVRRSGKSFLLQMYQNYLISHQIDINQIVFINFEHPDNFNLLDSDQLFQHLKMVVDPNRKTYFLFDEIQEVHNWQKLVNGLRVAFDSDIYITGSNASLLSGELSSVLAGRYVEINVLPLSFVEYKTFRNDHNIQSDNDSLFQDYIKYGGFPSVALIENEALIMDILKGIYNSIILKDVSLRGNIKDQELLFRVVNYLMGNIGQPISSNKISNYLISGGRNVSSDTIEKYLKLLEDSFAFYKAQRYDIRGKERLKTLGKYYVSDIGLRNNVLGRFNMDMGSQIENLVYLHLLRKGYQVFVGKLDAQEIDFVCFKPKEVKYVQVTYELPKNSNREFNSMIRIPDNYERIIITMNKMDVGNYLGINVIHLFDFLLD